MRRNIKNLWAALAAVFLAVSVGLIGVAAAPNASADTYYYLGVSGNAYTYTQTLSYSPSGRFAGAVRSGSSFVYSLCPGTNTTCSDMLPLSSSKLYWQPCTGFTDVTPRCNNPNAEMVLTRVQIIDDYGSIAHAQSSSAFSPAMFADDANSYPDGSYVFFVPHVTGLGNVDYVSDSATTHYNFTTVHDSGTEGFTTHVPPSWHPKMCYVFNVWPDVILAQTTVWSFSVCSPLYLH